MYRIFCQAICLLSLSGHSVIALAFDLNELNYGFSTYLGTGIYKIADREVQVYQIPFSYKFNPDEDNKWQLALRMPVTLGFYDFRSADALNGGLPDKVSTYSFVPGLEALYPVQDNWLLGAFFDIGFVENMETNETNTLYGAGFISRYEHQYAESILTVANKLLYAKDEGSNIEQADDFAYLETGLDLRFPSNLSINNRKIDFSVYYANYRYFDNLDFLRPGKRPVEVVIQNEVGFTVGLRRPIKYKYLEIPRLGIGYRFGDDLTIIRIIIGSAF